ncbi:unnamed protein product [Linum tenue]|uniref:Dirigent protein n=1 Tax=Linum tenue TaxID=586396 RepID=A0AAV0HSI3_9ROSI|nr:unnamed protein product [Linum tenue]
MLLNQYSLLSILLSEARLISSHPFSIKLSAKAMALKNEKLTHLHFYYHNLLAGPNVTALHLNAKGPLHLNDTAGLFGRLTMMDSPLTLEPELSSTTVGSARGLYGVASRTDADFVELFNFVFTADDEYRGSTVTVLGRNPILAAGIREMPVVGGTGVFGFARGKVHLKTHSYNATIGNALVYYITQKKFISREAHNRLLWGKLKKPNSRQLEKG